MKMPCRLERGLVVCVVFVLITGLSFSEVATAALRAHHSARQSSPTPNARPPQLPSYNGLQFPTADMREATIALDHALHETAIDLRSDDGYVFFTGARIEHRQFGVGTVMGISASDNVFVDFDSGESLIFTGTSTLAPVEGESRFGFLRDGEPVNMTTVKGLILIRDIYVAQMLGFADGLENLATGPPGTTATPEDRLAPVADGLMEDAAELRFARGVLTNTRESAVAVKERVSGFSNSDRNIYNARMIDLARAEANGDLAEAERIRASLEGNEWAEYLQLRQDYLLMLDRNPLLGLRTEAYLDAEGEPMALFDVFGAQQQLRDDLPYQTFVERYAALPGVESIEPSVCDGVPCVRVRVNDASAANLGEIPRRAGLTPVIIDDSGNPSPADWEVLQGALQTGAAQSRELAAEAAAYNKLEDFLQFGTPAYVSQQQAGAAMVSSTLGSQLPKLLIEEAVWVTTGATLDDNIANAQVELTLAGLAAVSLLIPVIGPFVAVGLGAIQLYRDGSDLYAIYGETEAAQARAAVTGHEYLGTLEDLTEEAETKTFVSAAGILLDAPEAVLQGVRVLRATSTVAATDDLATPAGFVRLADDSLAPPPTSDFLIPNGAAAVVHSLDEAQGTSVLTRIDKGELARFERFGEPGDYDFFVTNGLTPQLMVESGGRRYYLSRPFRIFAGTTEERIALVAFQETAGGTVVPRTFYLSNEHGVWRAATGQGSTLSKGPVWYYVEEAPGVRREATMAELESEARSGYVNEGAVDIAAELQGPLSRWATEDNFVALGADEAGRAFSGHVENPPLTAAGPLELAQWVNQADVLLPLPNGSLAADLSRPPLDQWSFTSPLYGDLEGFLYPSVDGNVMLVVLRDSRGNVWIPSIQDADAGLTPFGTRWSTFDPRGFNSTPLVHSEQGLGTELRADFVAEQYRGEYYFDTGYGNAVNQRIAGLLPAPGQTGGFDPTTTLDEISPPRATRVPAPPQPGAAATLPSGLGTVARVAMRSGSYGTMTADGLLEANKTRVEEIRGWLGRNSLPTTVEGLENLVNAIPANIRGENWETINRLRQQLQTLVAEQQRLEELASPSPATPPATDTEAPGDADVSGGTGDAFGIGFYTPVIPPISYTLTPRADDEEEEEDDDSSGTDTRDPETALDITAGNPISLNPFGFGDAVDLTFQSMTIELEFDGGSVTLPPGEGRELALRSGAARRMPPRLQDPMASARRLLFTGPTWTTRAVSAVAPAALPGRTERVAARHVSSSSVPGRPAASATPPAGRQQGGAVQVFLSNLGNSSGEAFTAQIFNTGSSPVTLVGGPLVVEPLKEEVQERVREQLDRLDNLERLQMNFDAYCLEYLKLPPLAGQVFQIADEQLQQRFAPMRDILSSSRELFEAGRLTPDIAPQDYFHSIRQWAIWTEEQGFDQASFVDAFIDHTRKNLEAQGQQWNPGFGDTLRGALGGRWNDIQMVLAEAGR